MKTWLLSYVSFAPCMGGWLISQFHILTMGMHGKHRVAENSSNDTEAIFKLIISNKYAGWHHFGIILN